VQRSSDIWATLDGGRWPAIARMTGLAPALRQQALYVI
jgi:hypothetical protein